MSPFRRVVASLKECLDPSELPSKDRSHLLRASGTRFIAHKVNISLQLSDWHSSVKYVDNQKIKGYTVHGKSFEGENFCDFRVSLLNHECFPLNVY